jgi:hypothetical protein
MSKLGRFDILVDAEKVIWIVLPFNLRQPIVVVSIGRFDAFDAFFHHENSHHIFVVIFDDIALLERLARKNHAKAEATRSLRARKLLNRRCASV